MRSVSARVAQRSHPRRTAAIERLGSMLHAQSTVYTFTRYATWTYTQLLLRVRALADVRAVRSDALLRGLSVAKPHQQGCVLGVVPRFVTLSESFPFGTGQRLLGALRPSTTPQFVLANEQRGGAPRKSDLVAERRIGRYSVEGPHDFPQWKVAALKLRGQEEYEALRRRQGRRR